MVTFRKGFRGCGFFFLLAGEGRGNSGVRQLQDEFVKWFADFLGLGLKRVKEKLMLCAA